MPRPAGSDTRYLPGLDGIRAVAVAAVVGYHLGTPWLPGGLLGVAVFFTLSGYLITSILISTWDRRGDLDLRHFWLRRARRLLPALIMVLIVVLVATPVLDNDVLPERGIQAFAALFFVSNWTTIASDVSYFQRFSGPGPLDHLWSLAVEEQFYLLWPLVLLLLFKTLRLRLERMALVTLGLAAVSFMLMLLMAAPGFDNSRVYEGTDARAGGLLIGAALAMVWPPTQLASKISANRRLIVDLLGGSALVIIVTMFVVTNEYSIWHYRGGILLLSLATAVLVGAAVHPASVVGPVLGVLPLRWIGERSYGIYLWHLPVVAFMPQAVLATRPLVRAGVQLALIILLSTLSWALLENPIRRQGLIGALGQPRYQVLAAPADAGSPETPRVRRRTPAVISGSVALLLIATASLTATAALRPPEAPQTEEPPAEINLEAPPVPTDTADDEQDVPDQSVLAKTRVGGSAASLVNDQPKAREFQTSCGQVVHIGDSTSIGLMSSAYQPNKENWVDTQYRKVGVREVGTDISGARSIVERWRHQPNAQDAVQAELDRGYRGCWVMAMGTNEAANRAVGGPVSSNERIDLIMKLIGDRPVLWLTVKTQKAHGPYANGEMRKWNAALLDGCMRYPNMRVYDWAGQVEDSWFINDGIHFTTRGYMERGKRIAQALARAFPKQGSSPGECQVRP
jgi:peptidoglycan/LPS O-acetylase OafA/YrhL